GRRAGRHDLATLANWAGTRARPCHRALPDAEATAELLVTLLGMLAERGVETLARAVVFGQGGGARYAHKLVLAEGLPAGRGVNAAGQRYLKLTVGEPFPRLYAVARPIEDGASYYGPVRSERVARDALEALHALFPLRACANLCSDERQGRLVQDSLAACAG